VSIPLVPWEGEIPDGYEPVRYGVPRPGEQYLVDGDILVWQGPASRSYTALVVRKVEKWRDAVPADLTAGPIGCRVKDDDEDYWCEKVLVGVCWLAGLVGREISWETESGSFWRCCQVLDKGCKQ
jgi:hypothetical protein